MVCINAVMPCVTRHRSGGLFRFFHFDSAVLYVCKRTTVVPDSSSSLDLPVWPILTAWGNTEDYWRTELSLYELQQGISYAPACGR